MQKAKGKKTRDINRDINRDTTNPWEQAIYDAEEAIKNGKARLRRLRGAILVFRDMRDSGEPWPGTSESEAEVLGQDEVLGQSRNLEYLIHICIPEYQRFTFLSPEKPSKNEGRSFVDTAYPLPRFFASGLGTGMPT